MVGGVPTPLKNMNVSWDDDIPNIWKKIKHVPNHQPVKYMKDNSIMKDTMIIMNMGKYMKIILSTVNIVH